MTVEKDSPNETLAETGEAASLVSKEPGAEAAAGKGKEEKKLRIVLQVEVKAEIDEVDDGKKVAGVNKISVTSEHIRAIVRIIGGGDVA